MNKKVILLTGATGFIGRNVLPILTKRYFVLTPSRKELNLIDEKSVDNYISNHKIDVVIHCAAANPSNKKGFDKWETFEDDIVTAFKNITKYSDKFEKILHLGSGADLNKNYDMCLVKESDFPRLMPNDPYAIAKYKITNEILQSTNIYNLRIFGCYGPTDAKTKFIRDAIDCCLENKEITIRQNCMFDYLYVEDLAFVFEWFIENTPKFHDYNISTAKPISLKNIAEIVSNKMNNKNGIRILKEGWNKEYTADNSRLKSEIINLRLTSIEEGIEKQIKWQKIYKG